MDLGQRIGGRVPHSRVYKGGSTSPSEGQKPWSVPAEIITKANPAQGVKKVTIHPCCPYFPDYTHIYKESKCTTWQFHTGLSPPGIRSSKDRAAQPIARAAAVCKLLCAWAASLCWEIIGVVIRAAEQNPCWEGLNTVQVQLHRHEHSGGKASLSKGCNM